MSTLDRFRAQVGFPRTIRIGQGGGFVFRDLDFWAHKRWAVLHFSGPDTPLDNAVVKAWNGRSRSECLNARWFLTLADAREKRRLDAGATTRADPMASSGRRPRSHS